MLAEPGYTDLVVSTIHDGQSLQGDFLSVTTAQLGTRKRPPLVVTLTHLIHDTAPQTPSNNLQSVSFN